MMWVFRLINAEIIRGTGIKAPNLKSCNPIQGAQSLNLLLVAEWIHFTRFGIILPTLKLSVRSTLFGAYELSGQVLNF